MPFPFLKLFRPNLGWSISDFQVITHPHRVVPLTSYPVSKIFLSHSFDCGLRFAIISTKWGKTTSAGQEAAKTGEYYEKG